MTDSASFLARTPNTKPPTSPTATAPIIPHGSGTDAISSKGPRIGAQGSDTTQGAASLIATTTTAPISGNPNQTKIRTESGSTTVSRPGGCSPGNIRKTPHGVLSRQIPSDASLAIGPVMDRSPGRGRRNRHERACEGRTTCSVPPTDLPIEREHTRDSPQTSWPGARGLPSATGLGLVDRNPALANVCNKLTSADVHPTSTNTPAVS
nr:hypothetical protein [Amycolatopsis taiwanensis]